MKILLFANESEIYNGDNSDEIVINTHSEVVVPDDDIVYVDSNGNIIDINNVLSVVKQVIDDIRSCYPSMYRVLMNKAIDVVDSPLFNTMATDGKGIFISPVFVQQLLEKDDSGRLVEYVLIHEIFHILFDHCNDDNSEYADHGRANAAQDFEINYNIETYLSEGIDDFPFENCTEQAGGLINPAFAGMGWKEIYQKVGDEYSSHKLKTTSQEWKDGFIDGYNEVMEDLLKQGKIQFA